MADQRQRLSLTALDDGSEASLWCTALADSCVQFEDAYLAEHGHMPLSRMTRRHGGPVRVDMKGFALVSGCRFEPICRKQRSKRNL